MSVALLYIALFLTYEPGLKGQCHEIFECWFCHSITATGPIRGTLGRFKILTNICRDIQQNVCLAVYDTPWNGDSAVYYTLANGDPTVYDTTWNCNSAILSINGVCSLYGPVGCEF